MPVENNKIELPKINDVSSSALNTNSQNKPSARNSSNQINDDSRSNFNISRISVKSYKPTFQFTKFGLPNIKNKNISNNKIMNTNTNINVYSLPYKKFQSCSNDKYINSTCISSMKDNTYNESYHNYSHDIKYTKPVMKPDFNINFNRKPKIRYLNFRPFVDVPKSITEQNSKHVPVIKYFYKCLGNDCPLIMNWLEDNGFFQCPQNSSEFTIIWSSGHIKLPWYTELTPWQKVNHFPRSNELTRKDLLYKNLAKLKGHFPHIPFNFLPLSFLLPNEHHFLLEEMSKVQSKDSLWIIKPVASSQGRGIFLTNNINDIPSGYNMIASKYISNPFLINNKKFDLRVYVFVTSINPLRIYRYKDGLVRFASDDYSPDITDRCSHLTNYAVNKNNKNYIKNNDPYETDFTSSKWNFQGFIEYWQTCNIDSEAIFSKIDDIIIKTWISCENSLFMAMEKHTVHRSNCYEWFGFDILLDSNWNTWLLEVNLSPNLHYDTPIDLKIKGEMLAECFDLMRIVPYDLRNENYGGSDSYGDISWGINSIKELQGVKIGKEKKEIIWESIEENKRCIEFMRIFPTVKYGQYRKLFDKEREINMIWNMMEMAEKLK